MSKILCLLFLCLFTILGVFAQGKKAIAEAETEKRKTNQR